MKKLLIFLIVVVLSLSAFGILQNSLKSNSQKENDEYLRIHIRANSNVDVDQKVKYLIKDKYIEYLTPKIADCKTKQDVVDLIVIEKNNLTQIANNVLSDSGFDYTAKVKICSELFPTRTYEGFTLQSGIYDAVIVELGSALGNNWWCVIYPPLCFTNFSSTNSGAVVYKSKILEIIRQFFS